MNVLLPMRPTPWDDARAPGAGALVGGQPEPPGKGRNSLRNCLEPVPPAR
jgi:hypothetical protein